MLVVKCPALRDARKCGFVLGVAILENLAVAVLWIWERHTPENCVVSHLLQLADCTQVDRAEMWLEQPPLAEKCESS